MKLKDLNDSIAVACSVHANVVGAVQAETFRQIRAALEKEDRVTVPEFGMFLMKDVPGENGEPAKKVLRFRERGGEKKNKKGGGQEGEGRQEGRRRGVETRGPAGELDLPHRLRYQKRGDFISRDMGMAENERPRVKKARKARPRRSGCNI